MRFVAYIKAMQTMPFSLADLVPKEVSFKLSTVEGETFTLRRWSLRVRNWAEDKYGSSGLNEAFSKLNIRVISDLTWFMLKDEDKQKFDNNSENFEDAISSVADQVAIVKACLGAVGIGEPEIKKIEADIKKKTNPKSRPK